MSDFKRDGVEKTREYLRGREDDTELLAANFEELLEDVDIEI